MPMTQNTDSGIGRRGFVTGMFPALFHRRGEREICGVRFRVMERGMPSPRRYLVIHGDEDTARDVLTKRMATLAGRALIVTGKTRHVEVRGLKIDPNRMYSKAGADLSLKRLNANAGAAKLEDVSHWLDGHREKLLSLVTPGPGSRLFALHNNRDYSVKDELAASDEVALNQPDMPRHFFLCTDKRDFQILKGSPYNVVLQTKSDPDDGSMSRLAARRGFRYINLECAIGDYAGQMARVDWLEKYLG